MLPSECFREVPVKACFGEAGERRLSRLEWASYNYWAALVAESLSRLELATQAASKTDSSIS